MGHETEIWGIISSVFSSDGKYNRLNTRTLDSFEFDDKYPWLQKSHFSVSHKHPFDSYMTAVIHFGLSFKDDPSHIELPAEQRRVNAEWLSKFETLLSRLYWVNAQLIIETEFGRPRLLRYTYETAAFDKMLHEDTPTNQWNRQEFDLPPHI